MITIQEAARRFRDGSLAPSALLRDCLDAVKRLNPKLNAFSELFPDAEAQAVKSDLDFRNGVDRGPLQGIPIGVKDLFDVVGSVTTCGAHQAFHPPPAAADSEVVARLRAAGAVLVGKTGLHEWAFGVSSNNAHFGPVRNPHDPERIAGGSSGGSAVALATGMCLAALGTDTGGSIRVPASLCGVVGLKPTWGVVPTRGLAPLSESLDTAGPMANSVEDVFTLFDVIAGTRTGAAPKPMLLTPSGPFFQEGDPEVLRIVREAIARAGPSEPVDLGDVDAVWKANTTILISEGAAVHEGRLKEKPECFGPGLADRFKIGFAHTAVEYARARKLQREWTARLEALLGDRAVLALPATQTTATTIGDREGPPLSRLMTRYTALFNLSGVPCLVVPAGKVAGLPVGVQFVAAPRREALLRALWA